MPHAERTQVQSLAGVTLFTGDLCVISELFRSAGHALAITVNDRAFATMEDAIDCIAEDMEVDLVSIVAEGIDHPGTTLAFTYRTRQVLLQTDSPFPGDQRAFARSAALLADRVGNGTTLCDIVTGTPERQWSAPTSWFASMVRLWGPTSATPPQRRKHESASQSSQRKIVNVKKKRI
ncbi:MAG: hypothetical protein H0V44_01880 [Planctomycetes bacterium]|nr:hypothetical protein [Planctomycetota bacterium]